MADWTAGYVSGIDYTHSYFGELNPLRARLALLKRGVLCPRFTNACELGFGQGLSVNIHAAATNCNWYGTDFNPSQAGFAREVAEYCGNNAKLYDDSFYEFANRQDLPEFDFIGIHGIWSWISEENQKILIKFLKEKLKVGGLVYISYNASPGQAYLNPIRKLMTDHAEFAGTKGEGIVSRVENSIEFANKLMETQPHYSAANPRITEKIKSLKDKDRQYLAHEYFNQDWTAMTFSEMKKELTAAKLDYAGSASFIDHLDVYNFTEEQQKFINEVKDQSLQESVRDIISNNAFRQDYWIKGARLIPNEDLLDAMYSELVMLCVDLSEIEYNIKCLRGEANLNKEIYAHVLAVLRDHEPHSIKEISNHAQAHGVGLPQVIECLFTLTHRGEVLAVNSEERAEQRVDSCRKINEYIMHRSRSTADQAYLASPLTGGGIPVSRIQQLFILAYNDGHPSAEGMASFVWEILSKQEQRLVRDGRTLKSDKENIQRLRELGQEFLQQRLVILQNLLVIPPS